MAWATVTAPTTGTPVATSTFGTPVAGNFAILSGARTSYTPTLTNITVGSGGTTTGLFRQVDKEIDFIVQITLGTSPSITGGATISLPVTALLSGWAADGSVTPGGVYYPAVGVALTTSTLTLRTWPTTAGNQWSNITSTVPGTFANTNTLTFWGRYPAA